MYRGRNTYPGQLFGKAVSRETLRRLRPSLPLDNVDLIWLTSEGVRDRLVKCQWHKDLLAAGELTVKVVPKSSPTRRRSPMMVMLGRIVSSAEVESECVQKVG